MRREGRIHGSAIRLHWSDPPQGRKSTRPTNHSKLSGRRLKFRNGIPRIRDAEVPHHKALKKTKGVFKEKRDYDVTTNYRLCDWHVKVWNETLRNAVLDSKNPHEWKGTKIITKLVNRNITKNSLLPDCIMQEALRMLLERPL
ncbi:hypothetical protein R1sor_006570 [Riccia sorocarpa]|uniref:HNH endonuclease n=1 Tax=Riccia sorocarpa TaxID=122646 RepID=A0ABD3HQY9_9MARC